MEGQRGGKLQESYTACVAALQRPAVLLWLVSKRLALLSLTKGY